MFGEKFNYIFYVGKKIVILKEYEICRRVIYWSLFVSYLGFVCEIFVRVYEIFLNDVIVFFVFGMNIIV